MSNTEQDDYADLVEDELSKGIWKLAWWAVLEKCSKEQFIAKMTNIASNAYDAQVHNARRRSQG